MCSVTQLCLSVCDPMARFLCPWNLPARTPKWVAIPFSKRSSRPRDQTHVSCVSCIGKRILYTAGPPGNPALEIRSTHNVRMPWHFWSKLNRETNPSSPWENPSPGMSIKEEDPQIPSPVNILPLHLDTPHNPLAKETSSAAPHLWLSLPYTPQLALPLWVYPCLNKLSL